jgi:uncharacterized membrane protein YccC
MMQWGTLAANFLWISGCALALAVLSYASWQDALHHQGFVQHLKSPGSRRALSLAGVLCCAGMAVTAPQLWQSGLWAVLAVFFIIQAIKR